MITDEPVCTLHAEHPEPGDLWHEGYNFAMLVIAVTLTHVAICRHKVTLGNDAYMIDFDRVEWVSRAQFRRNALFTPDGAAGSYAVLPQALATDPPDPPHWRQITATALRQPLPPLEIKEVA